MMKAREYLCVDVVLLATLRISASVRRERVVLNEQCSWTHLRAMPRRVLLNMTGCLHHGIPAR
jgi:hypothetical protein